MSDEKFSSLAHHRGEKRVVIGTILTIFKDSAGVEMMVIEKEDTTLGICYTDTAELVKKGPRK